MSHDKPSLSVVRLLNDLADVQWALTAAGFSPESVDRITRKVAEARIGPARAETPRPEPRKGWVDGVWTVLPNQPQPSGCNPAF